MKILTVNFNKDKRSSLGILGIILLIAFLFSLQCSDNIWNVGNAYTDSSVFRYVARVIRNGGMPYRDTFDHKGPLIYLINTLGLVISENCGIWFLELATIFFTFYYMYKIARLSCNKGAALLILVICSAALFKYFDGGNYTEEYALPFIAGSLFIFTDYYLNGKISAFRLILCGLCFGAVCMLRINMVALWGVMCLGAIGESVRGKNFKQLGRFILLFVTGLAIICLPILLWLCINGAFQDFIKDYFIFNVMYSNRTGNLAKVTTFISFINESLVLFAVCISVYNVFTAKKNQTGFEILYIVFIVLNTFLLSMSGVQYMHYGMILVPTLVHPFAQFFGDVVKTNRGKSMTVLGMIYLLAIFAIPNWLACVQNALNVYAGRNNTNLEETRYIAELVKKNTTKEEQIIVCGNWNIIYNLSERYAASKYSYQNAPCSVSEDIKNEFMQDLKENKPTVIVLVEGAYMYEDVMLLIEEYDYEKIYGESEGTQVYKSTL